MLGKSVKTFLRCEKGAVTVESMLWLVFFFAVAVSVLDICVYFLKHGWGVRALHQESRKIIVGEYQSCAELEAALDARIQELSPNGDSECEIDEEINQAIRTVSVTMIGRELGLGMWTFFIDGVTVSTSGLQVLESPLSEDDGGAYSDADDADDADSDAVDVDVEVAI